MYGDIDNPIDPPLLVLAYPWNSHQKKYATWFAWDEADEQFRGLQVWWRDELLPPVALEVVEHPRNDQQAVEIIRKAQAATGGIFDCWKDATADCIKAVW